MHGLWFRRHVTSRFLYRGQGVRRRNLLTSGILWIPSRVSSVTAQADWHQDLSLWKWKASPPTSKTSHQFDLMKLASLVHDGVGVQSFIKLA